MDTVYRIVEDLDRMYNYNWDVVEVVHSVYGNMEKEHLGNNKGIQNRIDYVDSNLDNRRIRIGNDDRVIKDIHQNYLDSLGIEVQDDN